MQENVVSIFDAVQKRIDEIKSLLVRKIRSFPDNPKIQRISTNPTSFVMKRSDMEDDWTPFYYDFKMQYEKLVQEIEKKKADRIILSA